VHCEVVLIPYPALDSSLNCSGLRRSASSICSLFSAVFYFLPLASSACSFQAFKFIKAGLQGFKFVKSKIIDYFVDCWLNIRNWSIRSIGFVHCEVVLIPYPAPDSSLNCLGLRRSASSICSSFIAVCYFDGVFALAGRQVSSLSSSRLAYDCFKYKIAALDFFI